MEFDLPRHLRDLSEAPSIAPDALAPEQVLRRVHRGRALRATGVAALSAAAVVGVAVAVVALPTDSVPPVETPTVEPTPSPDPVPAPTPSQTPTSTPTPEAPSEPPIVAVTEAGAVVLLDPQSGAPVATVMEGLSTEDTAKMALTVAPDRSAAYVSQAVRTPDETRLEIIRVPLDGSPAEVIAEGMQPAISPDGRTLAYVAEDPEQPGSDLFGLILLDIATGTSRYVPSGLDASGAGWIDQLAWSRDGTRLYVPIGYEGSQLVAVDAAATTLDGAVSLGDDVPEKEPVVLPDGTVLVACGASYAELDDSYVAAIDPATGSATQRLAPATGRHIVDMAAHPAAQSVAFLAVTSADAARGLSLYRWDEGTEPRLLGTGFLAVAW